MTPEDIVCALAAAGQPITKTSGELHCTLCPALAPTTIKHHAVGCPWRLAVEWVAAQDEDRDEYVGVRLRRVDAQAIVLGGLDYAVAVSEGKVPSGGSPMRLRVALRDALDAPILG